MDTDFWQEKVDLKSFDRDKQCLAVMRLGMKGGDKAIQLLIAVLQNTQYNSLVRAKAAMMLGKLRADNAVVELTQVLCLRNTSIPLNAVIALGNIGHKSNTVISALVAIRESSQGELREAVEEALIKLTGNPVEVALTHEAF